MGFGRHQTRYGDIKRIRPGVDQSMGQKTIGKVRVDCHYLAKSKWGVLQDADAWALYVDLKIQQPPDQKLANATITFTFNKDVSIASAASTTNDEIEGPYIECFGPKAVDGKAAKKTITNEYHGTPTLSAGSVSIGGVGLNRTTSYEDWSRWKIRGEIWAPPATGIALYRQAQWTIEENVFENEATHNNRVHVGLILKHDLKTFFCDIQIEGKLRGLSRLYLFSSHGNEVFRRRLEPIQNKQEKLDEVAKDLDKELTLINGGSTES